MGCCAITDVKNPKVVTSVSKLRPISNSIPKKSKIQPLDYSILMAMDTENKLFFALRCRSLHDFSAICCSKDQMIYIAGGYNKTKNKLSHKFYEINLKAKVMRRKTSLPIKSKLGSICCDHSSVYLKHAIIGSENSTSLSLVYDFETDK